MSIFLTVFKRDVLENQSKGYGGASLQKIYNNF